MKLKKVLLGFLALCLVLVVGASAQAQSIKTTASITKDFVLTLTGAAGTDGEYYASVDALGFKNEEIARAYWQYVRDNLSHFDIKIDDKAMYVVVYPHTQYVKGWSTAEWNTYFAKNKDKYTTAFNQFNK
ncbi:MAG: hypothetical protein EAZ57_05580 [Cytophagales bacterium]|nr:MAG: hypothetical protein EAZ67_12845 [Cytophagales bacterium]TAF61012.1 MAG: hypothetical protein EAZ57_05580 [Cytophagales bacterium]